MDCNNQSLEYLRALFISLQHFFVDTHGQPRPKVRYRTMRSLSGCRNHKSNSSVGEKRLMSMHAPSSMVWLHSNENKRKNLRNYGKRVISGSHSGSNCSYHPDCRSSRKTFDLIIHLNHTPGSQKTNSRHNTLEHPDHIRRTSAILRMKSDCNNHHERRADTHKSDRTYARRFSAVLTFQSNESPKE